MYYLKLNYFLKLKVIQRSTLWTTDPHSLTLDQNRYTYMNICYKII